MNRLTYNPFHLPYPTEVVIGQDLCSEITLFLQQNYRKRILVCDSALIELYGTFYARALEAELLVIPSGEAGKTFKMHTDLLKELFARDLPKDTILIALGGGATTDIVSFVASIYKRGLPLVLIPTTLLAIVDASIGGKTAINTSFGKNLIGTFYHPRAVFADLSFLKTLPQKEWENGRAEILKMGLIYDPSLCFPKGQDNLMAWITRAVQAKMDVVIQDPYDYGIRKILNFGHTIGHALEAATGYNLSHGQAVAIGSLTEAYLSHFLGHLSLSAFAQIKQLYSSFVLHLPQTYSRASFLQALVNDKKRTADHVRFVLIDDIGHALSFEGEYCNKVDLRTLSPTLDWMEDTFAALSPA